MMKPVEISLNRYQKIVQTANSHYTVVACGRRWGKTTLGIACLIERAITGDRCAWLAPTYDMADHAWREIKHLLLEADHPIINEGGQRIDLPGDGSIVVRSTYTANHLRGAGLDFVVLDEAAFMPPTVWSEVIHPMLLETYGGAMFLSTPYGKHNWFHQIFLRGQIPNSDGWRSFHYTSYDAPHIPKGELSAIWRTTPERIFRQEYLAQFTDDAGQVFRDIHAAAVAPLHAAPIPEHRYVAGLDWGRENDFTAIAIIDADSRQMVALDRFNQIGWDLQRGRIAALCDQWHPAVIWAEANSIGAPNIEALQQTGLPIRPFITTAPSKNDLINALSLAIERRDLALLPDETLLGELAAYQLERLPGGLYRYSAPPGLHDDTVIATALAWHAVQRGSTLISFA